jgi:tetratricopeptide (TPR) repeat protein
MEHVGAPVDLTPQHEGLPGFVGQNLAGLAIATMRESLEADPALRTPRALQYLIDVAHDELDRRPGRALGIMEAVIPFADAAEILSGDPLASTFFRANALKVYALALRLTEPAKARQTISTAVDMIDAREHPLLNARLLLVQALVLDANDESHAALGLAHNALSVFEEHGDRSLVLMAKQIEGAVLTSLHREPEAYQVFVAALAKARSLADKTSETRLLNNLGQLLERQGRLGDAGEYFTLAASRFVEAGMPAEAARVRWGRARILLWRHQYSEALAEFQALHAEMNAAGSGLDAVVASLDVAKTLIFLDRRPEARTICFDAADWFSAAGFPVRVAQALECLRTAWPASEGGLDQHEPAPPSPFAEQVAREDEEAERILGGLLEQPDRFEHAQFARRQWFRTTGVARRLCKAAREQCAADPHYAMNLAAAATKIASAILENGGAEETTIHEVLGQASAAYGSAALNLDRPEEALEAFAAAENAGQHVPDAADLRATVSMGRAIVHWSRNDWKEALACVRSAASTFAERHDAPRLFEAKQIEALILEGKGDRAAACANHELMHMFAKTMNDRELEGRTALNLAAARLDTGDIDGARTLFADAAQIFERLGAPLPAVRARLGIGRAELAAKRLDPATLILRTAIADLRRLSADNEASAATLDLAEALWMLGKNREVRSILASLVMFFRSSSTGDGADKAVLYLAERARAKLLTKPDIQHARSYIAELQRRPDLVFTPVLSPECES